MLDEESDSEKKKSHKEATLAMRLPLNKTSCQVIWNCLPGSKVNGISRLFIKKEKEEKLSTLYLLLAKSWPPPFLILNAWTIVKSEKASVGKHGKEIKV